MEEDTSLDSPRTAQRREECWARIESSNAQAVGAQDEGSGAGELFCPVFWDDVHCWPESPADTLVVEPCFDEFLGVYYDTSQNATRMCLPDGTWGNYSNYTLCQEVVPDSSPGVEELIFLVGFSLSLGALLVAVSIFHSFKDLKCLRNTIHTNLMWTFILYDALWIVTNFVQVYASSYIVCAFLVGSIHYYYLTNFFWMFVEGLYLFLGVVVTYTSGKIKLRVFIIIGWVIPAFIVVPWGFVKYFDRHKVTTVDPYDHELLAEYCPWMAASHYDWIHQTPVMILLASNLVFLISIMTVLITKLRSANTAEAQQYLKAAKALLILFPLLGVTNILAIELPTEGEAAAVFRYIRALLLSLQGFAVALFYCFLNTEVQNTLRLRLERWREVRALGAGRRYGQSSNSNSKESILRADLDFVFKRTLGDYAPVFNGPCFGSFSVKRESTTSSDTTATLLGLPGGCAPSHGNGNGNGNSNTSNASAVVDSHLLLHGGHYAV